MPELPDVTVYRERIEALFGGHELRGARLLHPFLLRTVDPPLEALVGRPLAAVERLGKRLVLAFDGDLLAVLHLMIAGRLRLRPSGSPSPGRIASLALDFVPGTLWLTEAGTKKRAALHVLAGRAGLAALDRGGLEVMGSDLEAFAHALQRENRTLKRALTDPRLLSGIGNAYSDEILHRARLSPALLSQRLSREQLAALHDATLATLHEWTERLRAEVGAGFPEKVTAFREGMAVHGRYRKPCPVCGTAVQRIRYADNECNYCPTCQTEGRLLADRGLSRLLREDWPKTLAELEERRGGAS
jgi:formamidopyrimidine-DNA glycosylase